MATLNVPGAGHASKTESYADGTSIDFNVFPVPPLLDAVATDGVDRAMNILDLMGAREPAQGRCNRYFRTLGSNQSFTDLWNRADVFVNYSPSTVVGDFAACHSNNRDLTLTRWCISTQNPWMIAATLCHELAHAAGAPGGTSRSAERATDKCYFPDQYDPTIVGSIQGMYNHLRTSYA